MVLLVEVEYSLTLMSICRQKFYKTNKGFIALASIIGQGGLQMCEEVVKKTFALVVLVFMVD